MSAKRIQWLAAFLTILGGAVFLYAQNPVSIAQIGTTAVTTTVPVSGTVTANQGGTWTVQPGNTANTTAWKVDGSAVTQPISASALPLPTGASTAAKQPALGIAGTASSDVLTVQGIASMTALKVDGSGVTQPVSGTVTSNQGGTWTVQPGNTANTTAWKVDGSAVTQPVSIAGTQAVNLAQVNGVTTSTGVGAAGTGTARVVDVASGTTGSAPPTQASYIGGLQSGATGGLLGGVTVGDTPKVINISTATTTLMITGVSGRQVHISSFHMIAAAADNVAWIEGTGATCGTGTAGMAGGTTAASGYNFAANGGIAMGTGVGDVLRTATTGDSVCLVTSAATQLSGHIIYAIY